MISKLRQWFKTKASYEKSLRKLKDDLYIRDRKGAYDESMERGSLYHRIRSDYVHEESLVTSKLRASLEEIQVENEDLKQQIISLTANGITLKNELDEFKREI